MLFSVRLTNRKTNEWRLFRVYTHCSRIYSYVYIYQCRHEFKLDRKIIHLTNCTELKEWEGWKGFLAHRNLGGVKDGIRYQVSGFLAYQIFLVWWGTYKRKQEGILFWLYPLYPFCGAWPESGQIRNFFWPESTETLT